MPAPGRTPAKKAQPSLRSEAASPDTSATEEGTTTVGPEKESTTDLSSNSTQEQTPEQKKIQELQDQLAKALGNKDPEVEDEEVTNPGSEENILVHFVRDGFIDLGSIWYKGQEVEVEPSSSNYQSAKKWADYSEAEQIEYFGDVYFRKGPWTGKTYEEEAAAKAERRRNRAAPRVVNK